MVRGLDKGELLLEWWWKFLFDSEFNGGGRSRDANEIALPAPAQLTWYGHFSEKKLQLYNDPLHVYDRVQASRKAERMGYKVIRQ